MNQYKDKAQVKSMITQAYLINQVLDEYGFTSVLDIGTGPGIIKRVLVKHNKLCHTVEQHKQWDEFKHFNPDIDFRMGYYDKGNWDLPIPSIRYDCVVLSRFFNLHHTDFDFESVVCGLQQIYADHVLIMHNPKAWRLNTIAQSLCVKHETVLWPIYIFGEL